MRIININGPINAGKTTISKLLNEKLYSSLFVEVDDLLSNEEKETLHLTQTEGWEERLKRLDRIIAVEKSRKKYENIIFAYPMSEKNYNRWKAYEDEQTKFINITLAPVMEVCLKNRGNRLLTDAEKERIKQMYEEGYHSSEFSDFLIDNSRQSVQETLQTILSFLEK